MSDDGRYLAFDTLATNVVGGAQGGVYVRDFVAGTTELISKNDAGVPADAGAESPSISGEGRFVAFDSSSTNLTALLLPSGFPQVYLFDRQTQHIELVSVSSAGEPANGGGLWGVVSGDGRFVAFMSQTSTNLDALGDPNGYEEDLFIHDRQTGKTERLDVASDGSIADLGFGGIAAALSDDAQQVAFESAAHNLTPVDPSALSNVFLRDRASGVTELESLNSAGESANGSSNVASISGDGKRVLFLSSATNLTPNAPTVPSAYLHDRISGKTELVSLDTIGQPLSVQPVAVMNSDARFVAFLSSGHVLVRDRASGITLQANVSADGAPGDGGVIPLYRPLAISRDGHTVAFATTDTNLVRGDTNGKWDIYVFHFTDLASLAASSPTPTVTPAKVPPTGGPASSPESPAAGTIAALGLLLCGGAFIVLRRNRHLSD